MIVKNMVEYIAHRGMEQSAPENTWSAFQKAVSKGYPSLELDLQVTKDGVVIIFHDHDLKRITGKDWIVENQMWSDLKDLDVGSWFHPSFSKEKIPLAQDIFLFFKKNFSQFLYLDIKPSALWRDDSIQKIGQWILDAQLQDQVYFCSFDHHLVDQARILLPWLKPAYSIENIDSYLKFVSQYPKKETILLNYDLIPQIDPKTLQIYDVVLWTIRHRETAESLIQKGFTRLITSFKESE